MIDVGNWRARAACRNADPEIFFDGRNTSAAKEYCRRCPVLCRSLCLAEGNKLGDPGVRGGLTAHERRERYGVRLGYGDVSHFPGPEPTLTEADVPDAVKGRQGHHITRDQLHWARTLKDDGWSVRRIAPLFGVHHTALARHLRRVA